MSTWSSDELAAIDRVGEIRVAGTRADGTARTPVIVWHVVVGDAVYARSVRGPAGKWYRGVLERNEGTIRWDGEVRDVAFIPDLSHNDAIDAAYVAKYGNNSATRSITTPEAATTTLRIEPRA